MGRKGIGNLATPTHLPQLPRRRGFSSAARSCCRREWPPLITAAPSRPGEADGAALMSSRDGVIFSQVVALVGAVDSGSMDYPTSMAEAPNAGRQSPIELQLQAFFAIACSALPPTAGLASTKVCFACLSSPFL